MPIFDHPDFDDHEQVLFCSDPSTGLKGIIALHSTTLGPAAGGCRMHAYASEEAALTDVLRLSKGMSYKNAVAGLPLGGGKCVIIADPSKPGKEALLTSMARHVQSLAGRYWTAIDIGVGPADAEHMAQECDYIFARESQFEPGFNASNFTAFGCFVGIQAVANHVWERDHLNGLRVAVQGLGGTGSDLCRRLHEAGAELVVADVREDAVASIVTRYGATAVPADEIHAADVDVFAPCAMGAVLNDDTIGQIKAKAICGVANNQLAEDRHGLALLERGIAYVPDYVVNAGGMLGASTIIFTTPSREDSMNRISDLYGTVSTILDQSRAERKPSSDIADAVALERIQGSENRS